MAVEKSPFEEEENLEKEAHEELLLLLALGFVAGVSGIKLKEFSYSDFEDSQTKFKTKASEVVPSLNNTSFLAIQTGVERAIKDTGLKGLTVDYSDQRFQNMVLATFNDNIERILQTNRNMFEELLKAAAERGWSDAEVARRFKLYYGLTPRFLRTILSMEDALVKEKLSKKTISERIQKRIDSLIEVRLSLAATLIGTEVVEGSKSKAFEQLAETNQLDTSIYVKSWESVIDESTTEICTSSHKMIAEIGGIFPNGYAYPPATNPVHPCRSSIRIRKRPVK